MGLNHSPSIVTNGLVLALDAANPKSYSGSGTVWTDLSGQNRNGTLVNSPTYNSANGSFSFSGSNNTTMPAVLPASTSKYTMGAWWYPTTSGFQVVYEQNSATFAANRRSAILILSTVWGFNGESNDAHDKVPVVLNRWVNGVITVDTTDGINPIKIYENGQLYWQGNTSGGASNLNMGDGASSVAKKITGSEYFTGTISTVSVYNRVLTANEIQQNFNATRGRYGL
jgi:hypothetical protein